MLRLGLLRALESRAQTPILPIIGGLGPASESSLTSWRFLSLLGLVLLAAVLPLNRRCLVRLRDRGEEGARVEGGPRLVEFDSQFAVADMLNDVCDPRAGTDLGGSIWLCGAR